MATLTITQNPWDGSRFLVSVHNPTKLIWTFQPTTDTKVITSTVTIGAYTFNGIETNKNTGATPDIYTYELNLTDILKYFHNSFYHKTVPDAISAALSDLVKSQLMTVNGLEDGVSTDTEYVTTLLSHGVNQIGNAYGATMQKLWDRVNSDRFHYFAGYPCELYWWTGPDPLSQWLSVDGKWANTAFIDESTGLAAINILDFIPYIVNKGIHNVSVTDDATKKITSWTNISFTTFTSSGANITSCIYSGVSVTRAESNSFAVIAGQEYILNIDLNVISGLVPNFLLDVSGVGSQAITLAAGNNRISFVAENTGTAKFWILKNNLGTSINCTLTVNEFYLLVEDGTFEIDTKDSNCGGKYIRYLSSQGYYKFWLFNKYFSTSKNQSKIGSLLNSFDTMVGQQARAFNIGYKDAYSRIIVTSENVSKEDQLVLMDIFTSPAVYIWSGSQNDADSEALWTLVEVEGSHSIREKNNFDNFSCTLVLPELYTQRL
jgi:hypothetical protein